MELLKNEIINRCPVGGENVIQDRFARPHKTKKKGKRKAKLREKKKKKSARDTT